MQAYHLLYHDTTRAHQLQYSIMESYLNKNDILQELTQALLDRLAAHQTTQALIIYQDQDQGTQELQMAVVTQLRSLFLLMASNLTTEHLFLVLYNPKPSKAANSSVVVLEFRSLCLCIILTVVIAPLSRIRNPAPAKLRWLVQAAPSKTKSTLF